MTSPGRAGRVNSTIRSDNSIALRVIALRPAMLVVSESWFPGWSVTVDGKSATVTRADAVGLGVPLVAGRHQVTLTYHAPGFKLGATVSSAALAGIVIAPAFLYMRRRRRGRKAMRGAR